MKQTIAIASVVFSLLISACGSNQQSPIQDETEVANEIVEEVESTVETEVEMIESAEEYPEEEILPAPDWFVESLKESWKDLQSPVELTYSEYVLGDYEHIIFADAQENLYDFGNADNVFGSYDENEFRDEESKQLGKKFKVTWEWKKNQFNCCEGAMDLVETEVPTIINVEPVE